MNSTFKLGGWLAAGLAVILSLAYSPVLAGYVFAGMALTIIAGLMAFGAERRISDWLLDHPWKLRHHRKA